MLCIWIKNDVDHSQSYGCLLTMHVGSSMLCVAGGWFRQWQGIRLSLFAGSRRKTGISLLSTSKTSAGGRKIKYQINI
jgi:hypothetical protein